MHRVIFESLLPTHTGENFLTMYSNKQKSNPRVWEIENPGNNKSNSEEQ